MVFSQRLVKSRKYLKLNQRSFAKRVGVDQGRVSQWENGKSLPSSSALTEIVRLGININWLLTGDGNMMAETQSYEKEGEIFSEELIKEMEKIIDRKINERLSSLLKSGITIK
jgi:transcriptional regulator with XRE-family HTH domain